MRAETGQWGGRVLPWGDLGSHDKGTGGQAGKLWRV